jgi:hypothetical protein
MKSWKRFLLLLLFIGIGIGFAIGFGIIFYNIRKKKDNQIKLGGTIKDLIIPCVFFWFSIGILIIVKCEYFVSLQLFIVSGIILASFLAAISTKKIMVFFIGFGAIVVELGLDHLIRKIVSFIICRIRVMKAKKLEAEKSSSEKLSQGQ